MNDPNDRMNNDPNPDHGFLPPPSRLHLPKIESPPATILAHLIEHFPQVSPHIWRERVARGLVTSDDGTTVGEDSPYLHGITIFYRKEVPSEPDPLDEEVVLYRDEEILVADKPHGMVVTPAGDHVERSLLVRLQRSTGVGTLTPAHRLDRDTAGVVLLIVKPAARQHYHRLFAEGALDREYLAVAHLVDARTRRNGSWKTGSRKAILGIDGKSSMERRTRLRTSNSSTCAKMSGSSGSGRRREGNTRSGCTWRLSGLGSSAMFSTRTSPTNGKEIHRFNFWRSDCRSSTR